MKVTTIEIFKTEDQNRTHDHLQRYFFVDDELVLKGSNIKNNIDAMIIGALAITAFSGKTYTHKKIRIPDTNLYYDFIEMEPQEWLEKCKSHDNAEITTMD